MFDSYGRNLTPSELLLDYGFVDTRNRISAVTVRGRRLVLVLGYLQYTSDATVGNIDSVMHTLLRMLTQQAARQNKNVAESSMLTYLVKWRCWHPVARRARACEMRGCIQHVHWALQSALARTQCDRDRVCRCRRTV